MKIILMMVTLCCGMFVSAQEPEEPFYESGNAFVRFCTAADRVSDLKSTNNRDEARALFKKTVEGDGELEHRKRDLTQAMR